MLVVSGGVLVGEAGGRASSGGEGVDRRLGGLAVGRSLGEVVCERLDVRVGVGERLERLADPTVEPHAPRRAVSS